MRREKGFIDLELYQRVVEECSKLEVGWIYLFHMGESLLHPKLREMIDFAQFLGVKIRLHTNGTLNLLGIEVDKLCISVNATSFSRIQGNIDRLIEEKRPFEIVSLEGLSCRIPREYSKYLVEKSFHSWQGAVRITKKGNTLCSHPYKAMVLLWDGRVVPCCADYDAKHVVGDFREQTLQEIWNSGEMQAIRAAPVPMCKRCTVLREPILEEI